MLRDFGTYRREHFPRDLTLRGADMNATMLGDGIGSLRAGSSWAP